MVAKPTVTIDRIRWPVMVLAEACLCAAWEDLAEELQPALCGILPGRDVAADDCCGGQAWVRHARTFRSSVDEFPNPQASQTGHCDDEFWAIELGIGVLRCHSFPSAEDGSVTAADWAALRTDALQLSDDEARVRAAVACCLQEKLDQLAKEQGEVLLQIGETLTVGPEGGCVGFEMIVTIGVSVCPCVDDEED